MGTAAHYPTFRSGRDHLKDLLDAAAAGCPTSVTRDLVRVAAVDADRLLNLLTGALPANATVVAENDGWSIFLPGLPIAADGATLDEEVLALRDYTTAWTDRLRLAPNHRFHIPEADVRAMTKDEAIARMVEQFATDSP